MKNLTQTAIEIAEIIEEIDIVVDRNYINHKMEFIITKILQDSLSKIKNIDIMELYGEVWSLTSLPNRTLTAEKLLSSKFKSLLNWKKHMNEVSGLKAMLQTECAQFFNRAKTIGVGFSTRGINETLINYEQLGLQLLMKRRDCERLIEKIRRKAEDEMDIYPEYNNVPLISLNPDNVPQFVANLKKWYKEGYFIAASQEDNISEEDVLLNFQRFLNTNFTLIEENTVEITSNENFEIEKFLLHSNKNLLAGKIKETFNTEKGKAISLLLYAMETNDPPLISVGNRQLKSIYRALKALFNRDIGTYQSITYKYIEESDKPDLDAICLKLNHILAEMEKHA